MKNALKGAFLSGLVFPGLGHVVLKRYKRGFALMLASLAGLFVIAVQAVRQALSILEKIELKDGNIDFGTVSDAARNAAGTSDSLIFNSGLILILACWIIGIVDAYRIGRKKDLKRL